MEQSTVVYNRLNEYQLFEEWTGKYTSYTDELLYGHGLEPSTTMSCSTDRSHYSRCGRNCYAI